MKYALINNNCTATNWSTKRGPTLYCIRLDKWEQETIHDYWDTSCKNAHCFSADGPKENYYKYCPYCGKKIKVR